MIIVPLNPEFGDLTEREQDDQHVLLQRAASSAGLAGTVTIVWVDRSGRFNFRAPVPWHPFFRSINVEHVHRNLNRQISW